MKLIRTFLTIAGGLFLVVFGVFSFAFFLDAYTDPTSNNGAGATFLLAIFILSSVFLLLVKFIKSSLDQKKTRQK
jgi:hypothetical protein